MRRTTIGLIIFCIGATPLLIILIYVGYQIVLSITKLELLFLTSLILSIIGLNLMDDRTTKQTKEGV